MFGKFRLDASNGIFAALAEFERSSSPSAREPASPPPARVGASAGASRR
jgi:hypothetical protein